MYRNTSGMAGGGYSRYLQPGDQRQVVWTLTSYGTRCVDVADGSEVNSQKLDVEIQASPSLVGDMLYLLTVLGDMILIGTEGEYHEIKRLKLGEKCYATPAFAPGRIVIRGQDNLYCIGERP